MILVIVLVLVLFIVILKLTNPRCTSKVCLVGKTAIITGGNSGLGLATARTLASRGCKIIIADKDDAKHTVERLFRETHNPHIFSLQVDFASFASVRVFAEIINATVDRLDILVNNAGVGDPSYVITEDGLQKIMQVNYFSHFLLVHLLADLLCRSAPSRILYTSSLAAYLLPTLTIENLKGDTVENTPLLSTGTYGNSKLAGAIASRIFAEKFRGTGVTSNCYHPGFVKTRIFKSALEITENIRASLSVWAVAVVTSIIGKTAEEGAQIMVHLATSDEVQKVTGQFYFDFRQFPQPRQLKNKEFCRKVWYLSEEVVRLKPEEKLDYVVSSYKKIR